LERKEALRNKWLEYREQKRSEPVTEEVQQQVSTVLRKKRRLPKKRGRKKLDMDHWLQNQIRNNLDA
jgi:hypothetical protein